MTVENLQLMKLSHEEARFETFKEMKEDFVSFEKVGLEALFAYFTRNENEV